MDLADHRGHCRKTSRCITQKAYGAYGAYGAYECFFQSVQSVLSVLSVLSVPAWIFIFLKHIIDMWIQEQVILTVKH